jgi:hypothetical protein
MGLLLHLSPAGLQNLPLQPSYPRQWPYTQMVNRVLLDQIDPFHYKLMCEPIGDILKLPANTKSFGDVAEEHANAMKAYNAPIYIMYSGGIDSSAAVIAFLRTWSPQELERVHILASHHSVEEFPELWNVIVDKFRNRIHPSFQHPEHYCERGYLVTGEHGDQLFGSDVLKHIVQVYEDEGIHKPWQETMPAVYHKIFGKEFDVTQFISRYEPTLSACPFPIKTSFDWVWWFNFTNKWQHVKYRLLGHKTWNTPQKSFERIKHFYDTPAWQRWSLDNHDKKIGASFQSYKLAAKAYIVAATGFSDYVTKPKVGSLFQIWRIVEFYEAIDDSFRYLERAEAVRYVR